MELNKTLVAKTQPKANPRSIIEGKGYRITVLKPSLIRVEVQESNIFTDDATQYVWFRDFGECKFEKKEMGSTLVVETEKCKFNFSLKKKKVMSVYIDSEKRWVPCDNKGNLGGTCRTLDMKRGRVKLSSGVLSKNGVAVLGDDGIILKEDGTLSARTAKETDLYIFAYGKEYQQAINAYFDITGRTPMLPRYVLGNWWSRYYAYTQDEYLSLMTRFEKENMPFTVATVDMDWHYVNVNEKFGTDYKAGLLMKEGWTGYSWNTDLFPDYRLFLNTLHEKNLHVTLNLHPADGIRSFETVYPETAKAMGIDPATKRDIPFDISDNRFINTYFEKVHHPYEDEGVDFWWIDWQQGTKSTIDGVDPLWALNHYHFLDNSREGRRGLVLSRFCGIGAHRYPLGFSGDYITRWASLNYQPEFTGRASNIGYDWWSHDIAGHNFGVYDDEMYLRWCQYGVFSPINRLHSSCLSLMGKEPWKHSETVKRITGDYLRLRHALIPYIYTAMHQTATENIALCRPMYHVYPNDEEAYTVNNEYYFGSELIVCPVTTGVNKKINLAETKVWLPKGRYTDIFTGEIYDGGRKAVMCRDLEYIPVLAREGAIVPMSADEGNTVDNPKHLKVLVYRGNNTFRLYEDDGMTNKWERGEYVTTALEVKEEGDRVTFVIHPAQGELTLVPEEREYTVCLKDLVGGRMSINGEERKFSEEITLTVKTGEGAEIVIDNAIPRENGDIAEEVNIIYSRYQGNNILKVVRYRGIKKAKTKEEIRKAIKKSLFPKCVKIAALEKFLYK